MASAQNYNCFVPGAQPYFTNCDGYLRGIRIDSVTTYSDSTIYFPYHTARGIDYRRTGMLDTNGGSWVGQRVTRLNDGTFLFGTLLRDTFILKTQARMGDIWTAYSDSSSIFYRAQVVREDTLSFSGITDSVKTILIRAMNGSGVVPGLTADSLQIIISKNNGLVQVPDLYTFPYQASSYPFGFDYYFDAVLAGRATVPERLSFKRVAFSWPLWRDSYNWNTGDVYEQKHCETIRGMFNDCPYPFSHRFDSVTSKTPIAGGWQYTTTGWLMEQNGNVLGTPDAWYPYVVRPITGSITADGNPLFDTTRMPEEQGQPLLFYYSPGDTSKCITGDKYVTYTNEIRRNGTISTFVEGIQPVTTYKNGLGQVQWYTMGTALATDEIISNNLFYYRRGGVSCGRMVGTSLLAADNVTTLLPEFIVMSNGRNKIT
ncbi:MAG: hypothetical protein EBZ77_09375, partial [Chitinophagia bacterium]|nr:hypothetical protein [Chitinophagia bacterium]